jgi:hypothetical protein
MLKTLNSKEVSGNVLNKLMCKSLGEVKNFGELKEFALQRLIQTTLYLKSRLVKSLVDERGDVPGWVLVVLMTTGLVTAIWAIAKPNLTSILNNSLNAMNGVR